MVTAPPPDPIGQPTPARQPNPRGGPAQVRHPQAGPPHPAGAPTQTGPPGESGPPPRAGAPSRTAALRRILVGVVVVAFGIAAILGIVTLIVGSLGETASKVLITTAVIGAYSIGALCCVALVGRRLELFGLIGALVAVASAAYTVFLVWVSFSFNDAVYQVLWTVLSLTVAWSFASLLLLLSDRRRPVVRWGLRATLGLFVAVLLVVWFMIWFENWDNDVVPRLLGVVAILATLGAIVVPVLSILLPDQSRAEGALPEGVALALVAEAERRGVSVEELVRPVLRP